MPTLRLPWAADLLRRCNLQLSTDGDFIALGFGSPFTTGHDWSKFSKANEFAVLKYQRVLWRDLNSKMACLELFAGMGRETGKCIKELPVCTGGEMHLSLRIPACLSSSTAYQTFEVVDILCGSNLINEEWLINKASSNFLEFALITALPRLDSQIRASIDVP